MRKLQIAAVRHLTFGRHVDRSFEGLDAPFVVVHGPNESGKSTLAEFLVWAIGGPWMAAKEALAFKGITDGNLRGTLFGSLGGDEVELEARFRLLLSGIPNDKRKGTIGAHAVDHETVARNLGGLTPSEFQLIYRLYGASLGDVGSAKSLSDLFTNFALGSASAVANPRQVLKRLMSRSDKEDKDVEALRKNKRAVDGNVREASRIPDEIADLESQLGGLNSRIEAATEDGGRLQSRRDLLNRAHSGIAHLDALAAASAELTACPDPSNEWTAIADNLVEVRATVDDIVATSREMSDQESTVGELVRQSGLDRGVLAAATLTLGEGGELSEAVRNLVDARRNLAEAESRLEESTRQKLVAESDVDRLRRALGVDESMLVSFDRLGPVLDAVLPRAVLWKGEVDKAIEAERAESASAAGGGTVATTAAGSLRLWILLAAIVGAGALSALHWIAGLVGAIGAAVLAFTWRRPTGLSPLTSGDVDAVRKQRAADAAGARAAAAAHKKEIDGALGVLSGVITHPDSAQAELQQLRQLFDQRSKIAVLEEQVERDRAACGDAHEAMVRATERVESLFGPRSIPSSIAGGSFDQWLAIYKDAIGAVAAQVQRAEKRDRLARQLDDLVGPVRDELSGLGPTAVIERVEAVHDDLAVRRAVESRVREAEMRVAAASLDSDEIRELLHSYPTGAELGAQIEQCDHQIAETKTNRDAMIAERQQTVDRIAALKHTDTLQTFLLQRGLLDEEIEEATARKAAADLAVKVLSEAIDGYERENQDPVVATASNLIATVVPDWGTVIMSREENGTPILRRSTAAGSLDDRAISDGGRALLYLGIRLAFAQKDAERRSVALPIICDDPLIHFDDERRAAAIALLHDRSKHHQVLLFTCDDDTRDRARELGAAVVQI